MNEQRKSSLSSLSQIKIDLNKLGNNDNSSAMDNKSTKIIPRFNISSKLVKSSIKMSAHELTTIKNSSKIKEKNEPKTLPSTAPKVITKLSSVTKNLLSEFVRRSLMKSNKNSLESIIEILKLKHELRTKENIKWLKMFILESKLKEYLTSFNKMSEKNLDDIVLPLIAEMKYGFYPINKVIFKTGSLPKKYLLIIKGKIDISKYEMFKDDLTCFEYMEYIYRLYFEVNQNGDKIILDKTLEENKDFFNISHEEIQVFNYILLKDKLGDYIKELNKKFIFVQEPIEKILTRCFYKKSILESINYDPNKKNELNYMTDIINKILAKLKPVYDEDIIKSYLNFLYQNKKKI